MTFIYHTYALDTKNCVFEMLAFMYFCSQNWSINECAHRKNLTKILLKDVIT